MMDEKSEECPYCGALFSVKESGGNGICGACKEPIDCPHCNTTVRHQRTTGVFHEQLVKQPPSEIARYLGITDEQLEEIDIEFNEDTGNSGETIYSYWFYVPANISDEIIEHTGWKPNQLINGIPASIFNGEE
jgi:hypothetical protein